MEHNSDVEIGEHEIKIDIVIDNEHNEDLSTVDTNNMQVAIVNNDVALGGPSEEKLFANKKKPETIMEWCEVR